MTKEEVILKFGRKYLHYNGNEGWQVRYTGEHGGYVFDGTKSLRCLPPHITIYECDFLTVYKDGELVGEYKFL